MNNPNRTPNPLYGNPPSSSGPPPAAQQPYPPHQPHHHPQSSAPHHHHHQQPPPHHHQQPPQLHQAPPSQHPQYQPKPQQPPPSHHSQPSQQPQSQQSQPPPQQNKQSSTQHSQPPAQPQPQQQETAKQIQQMSQEERVLKLWSNMRYTVASSFEKAQLSDTAAEQKNKKEFQAQFTELSKNILHFLTYRRDYHRLLSQIEAKLEGKAQERQALETYVRTAPRLGKRKRADPSDSGIAGEVQAQSS